MIDYNKLKSVDIEKLFIFNELCRAGSIKKCLVNHDITSRTIYYTLQVLEAAFDVKLFIKGKRDIILTDEGEKLYNLSMIFLESLKSVKNTKDEDYTGRLTVHTNIGFAQYYMPTIIKEFCEKYNNITLKVLSGPEYLAARFSEFDVIIGLNPINRRELTKQLLRKYEYSFYGSESYFEKKTQPLTLDDFKGYDLLCYSGEHLIDKNIIMDNNILFESNLYPLLLDLCDKGLGIASLPENYINDVKYEKKFRLINLFNGYIAESEPMYFSYKSYSDLQKPINDMRKIITKHLDKYHK